MMVNSLLYAAMKLHNLVLGNRVKMNVRTKREIKTDRAVIKIHDIEKRWGFL